MQTIFGIVVFGGLRALWVLAPLAVVVGVGLRFTTRDPGRRKVYARLLILLAPWVLSALWTVVFQNRAPGQPMAYPAAVASGPLLGAVVELILAIVLIVRLKGARISAAALGLLNLYISVLVWFWGAMAISGVWA